MWLILFSIATGLFLTGCSLLTIAQNRLPESNPLATLEPETEEGTQPAVNDTLSVINAEVMAVVEQTFQVIYQNVPVEAAYPQESERATLDYRSKKALEGNIRIVTIPGADRCACCGTHVRHTGEIGLIRLIKAETYKGGTRVSMLCGLSAWQEARTQALRVQAIAAGLSSRGGQRGAERTAPERGTGGAS